MSQGRILGMALLGLAAHLVLTTTAGAAQSRPHREQGLRIARGRALARAYCSSCHAVEESGGSPNPQAPAFRDLHRSYPVGDLVDALSQGARAGHPAMPRFHLPFEQSRDLVAYVRSIQPPPSAL